MELMQNVARHQQQAQTNLATDSVKTPTVKEVQQVTVEKLQQESVQSDKPQKLNSQEDLQDLVKKLNSAIDPFRTSLRFGFDNSQEVFFVSVIDTQSNKLIRRFPAEEATSLLSKMQEVTGVLFDEKG